MEQQLSTISELLLKYDFSSRIYDSSVQDSKPLQTYLETRTSGDRSAEQENISSVPGDTEVHATDVFAALANVSSKTGRRNDFSEAVHGVKKFEKYCSKAGTSVMFGI